MSGNPLSVLTDKAEELGHSVTYQFDTLTDLGRPEKNIEDIFCNQSDWETHTENHIYLYTQKLLCRCMCMSYKEKAKHSEEIGVSTVMTRWSRSLLYSTRISEKSGKTYLARVIKTKGIQEGQRDMESRELEGSRQIEPHLTKC